MGDIDEAELASAGQRGTVIDGMADGGKRTVQADLLRTYCHELKDRIDPRGLRLTNVIVAGGGRLLCLDTIIDGQGDRAIQADRIHVGVRSGCCTGSSRRAR